MRCFHVTRQFAILVSFASHGEALESARLPALESKGKFALTKMGVASLSTCDQVCASMSLGCDLQNLPWKKSRDMKTEMSRRGYNCAGTDMSGSIAAPMIALSDARDRKGTCFYPRDFSGISCDMPAADGYRNVCYCTKDAKDAVAAQTYQSVWPYEWVFPLGEGETLSASRKEVCVCYAKKGASGASAMPPEIFTNEDMYSDNGAYEGMCATFCKDQPSGPYHAADVHLLADWSSGRPAIIVLHGQSGSKDEQYTQMMAKKFASAGFIVMALNYTADTCSDDIGNAVEWLRTEGISMGVDPNSVGLYGWSHGGRCVYKAVYKNHRVPHQSVKAVVDMSGCGGKGPLNDVDKNVTTMPPPLLLAHAENDRTISIKDCQALVKQAKKKSWNGNGSKGKIRIKELYFGQGGHNLLKHSASEPVVINEVFDHFFKYLGRPCKRIKETGLFGHPPMDMQWPTCKTSAGESIDRCGGVYDDFSLVKKSCDYP